MDSHRAFMQTPSIQQARSRLESNTVELRKKKRIEQQLRRRVQVPETELVFDISLLSIEPRLVDSNQSPIELLQLLFGVLEIEPPTGQLHTCLACIQTIISSFTEEYASLHDAELRPLYELSSRRIKEYLDTSAYPAEIVHEALLLLSDLTASSTTFCYAYCELGGVEQLLRPYTARVFRTRYWEYRKLRQRSRAALLREECLEDTLELAPHSGQKPEVAETAALDHVNACSTRRHQAR
mmetsp:Transcript_29263/g.52329  ORF Transcript_29263/g.52329 Transcript_29263/m.52329 type:complete len:239 (-) Transcript_29263:1891-2607(-)